MRLTHLLSLFVLSLASCSGDSDANAPSGSGGNAGAAGTASDDSGTSSDAAAGASGSTPDDAQAPDAEAGAADAADGSAGASGWHEPACTSVTGTWAVTFTSDDGATVAPGEGVLSGVEYTYGLAALDTPDVLVAEHAGRLLRSDDAGCTWADIGAAPDTIISLVAAKGGLAYGFKQNDAVLFLLDGTTVTSLSSPTTSIHGLGVDPDDGLHLMIGADDGQMWESHDGGQLFEAMGVPAPRGCFYVVAFDPNDLQHIVCGTIEDGTFVSMDGGASWIASEGDATYANAFSVSISPADGDVVWVEGFQLGWHNGQQIGPEARRIWRSTDGGLTFEVAIEEETTTAHLFNGNLLAAAPHDADVLYFTFGPPPIAGMASESFLYRFEASTATLTEHKQTNIDGYDALVFSPANPQVIYLGRTSERPGGV